MCNLSQGIVDRTIITDIMNLMDSLVVSPKYVHGSFSPLKIDLINMTSFDAIF